MIQVLFPLITAIALSSIAAFYSVIGLAQIFPGSFWPIILMGTVLEVAKLVTVSWLYNNWNVTVRAMRYYFLTAIVLLMLITSMGIFGFLSRAHIESSVTVGQNTIQLQIIEKEENLLKEKLNYLLLKAGNDPERIAKRTDVAIQETQKQLIELSQRKLPLLQEENKLMAEIGPIKFIAEMLYGKEDPNFIDKAVRVVIFVIIFVFDPLAVLLLIAANQTYRNSKIKLEEKENDKKKVKKKVDISTAPSIELFTEDTEVIPKSKITKIGEIQ
jgi:hypothetical protein